MSLFSHKQKDTLIFIIDIQSSVVRGTIVLFKVDDVTPVVTWTSSIDIAYRKDSSTSQLIESTVKAIEEISVGAHKYIRDVSSHANPLPSHLSGVHCVLSSPWIMSQAKTVTEKFEKNSRISRSYVRNIINEARENLSKNTSEGMMSIEEKIFDVRLNGYSVSNWENNSAMTFEVSFAISLAGKQSISSFKHAVERSGIHPGNIHFHSSLLLQHLGINKVLSLDGSYILVHVHGELTDVVVATGSMCVLFGSYPIGVRSVIRSLAGDMNSSLEEADSAIALYEDSVIDPNHAVQHVEQIRNSSSLWVGAGKDIISSIPDEYKPSLAIISSRFHEPFFVKSFASEYKSMKVDVLPEDTLTKLVVFDPQAEKLRLTLLYISAIHSLEIL